MRNPSLGELEFAIMEYVWSCSSSVTVPEVHARVGKPRRLAYTTVMTVMGRLHEKGLLHRDGSKRPYTYWPATSRADYSAGLMLGALEGLRDRRAVLARFVERIGPKDAELLRALAAKARSRRR